MIVYFRLRGPVWVLLFFVFCFLSVHDVRDWERPEIACSILKRSANFSHLSTSLYTSSITTARHFRWLFLTRVMMPVMTSRTACDGCGRRCRRLEVVGNTRVSVLECPKYRPRARRKTKAHWPGQTVPLAAARRLSSCCCAAPAVAPALMEFHPCPHKARAACARAIG